MNRDRPHAVAHQSSPQAVRALKRWAPRLVVLAVAALAAWVLLTSSPFRAPRKLAPPQAPVTNEPVKRPLSTIDAALVS